MTFRYDFAPTPFGDALAVFSESGLIRFDLPESDFPPSWLLDGATRTLQAAPTHSPGAATTLTEMLDAYFEGEPIRFDDEIVFDWSLTDGFARRALQEICEIPWAETASYGEIAIHAGSPGAARAVGTACRLTPFSLVIPVHRVVRSDGSPGQYGAHPERKRYLIDLEADSARRHGATPAHG